MSMKPASLEQLLENPAAAPFYDLLGGLADNLLTIGPHAGTFLECDDCGKTFTLKDQSWACECCGREFQLKFDSAKKLTSQLETEVRVRVQAPGLRKPRWNPRWYHANENWSVAELMNQLLRLQPETFLSLWLRALGIELRSALLDSILCWPRFRFGGKTIQPDVAMGFEEDIIFFEFKRPGGGLIPPTEVLGQMLFAVEAGTRLNRDWNLVLVPGRDSIARSPAEYVDRALAALSKTKEKWAISEDTLQQFGQMSQTGLAARLRVLGWESLLTQTGEVVRTHAPPGWARDNCLRKLQYFHASRAEDGLLSAPAERCS